MLFGLKMLKLCQYFRLQALFGGSMNIYSKEVPLFFKSELLRVQPF